MLRLLHSFGLSDCWTLKQRPLGSKTKRPTEKLSEPLPPGDIGGPGVSLDPSLVCNSVRGEALISTRRRCGERGGKEESDEEHMYEERHCEIVVADGRASEEANGECGGSSCRADVFPYLCEKSVDDDFPPHNREASNVYSRLLRYGKQLLMCQTLIGVSSKVADMSRFYRARRRKC